MPAPRRSAAFALLILAAASPAGAAGIRLGAPFGDHMVVQRDRPVRVWGEAAGGAGVEVRLGPRMARAAAAADGRWSATLEALPAGGPYVLAAESGGEKAGAADVLVGDVWLCSGQSNMQMTLKECDGGLEAAEAAGALAKLRLGSIGRRASAAPESGGDVRWRVASRDSARDFSGVGFFFAADLSADPALRDVPLGVLDASFGGTMCEAWTPAEALAGFARDDLRDSMFGVKPSALYNGMIAPLGKAPIKGVVWYQGEGNSDRPASYPRLLAALIASWRGRFESPDLPFIVVQLPDYAAGWGGVSWAWMREAQASAVRATEHASLAVGIDTNDGSDLHPRRKREIGRRAALLALHDVYGRPVVARGPEFQRATPEGGSLRVAFDAAGDGLASRGGGPIRGFAVAGADGRYRYADAVVEGDAVVLRSEAVPAPLTVRYAWGGAPGANLVNRAGLPAAPFRTDGATRPDADVQRPPVGRIVRTRSYETAINGVGSVTSLVVGGRQFLSNEPGWGGGTTITGGLAPRELADVHEPGPGCVAFRDDLVDLVLEFGDGRMDWTVANRGKDEIRLRIALHPRVAVRRRGDAEPVELRRDAAAVLVTGVDVVSDSEGGPVLEAVIGGQASKRLSLSIPDR
ncbi:sialate O-acetylesterase [Paludisphaera mucosa]|uniref:Sialate O-acetylesterase n=1 Tax=Paludisphaera mucosa TaxID=3030827 RepID=A0ABT6FJ32_9BACT|nr:sialate O-acetylesterase [Paludisphaera mucosa]MDG3007405.1 sialate O-acetylesterase [Paludisphaera mucosa]